MKLLVYKHVQQNIVYEKTKNLLLLIQQYSKCNQLNI